MGDGVLVYFGYPQAHEDDAEQAMRAGLALVEAVANLRTDFDAALQVRIGIATGTVVVGDLIGEGAAQEQAVVGETPNLAARLQAARRAGYGGDLREYAPARPGGTSNTAISALSRSKAGREPTPAWQVAGHERSGEPL